MKDRTISKFRVARGRILARQIRHLSRHLGRRIVVLDVGGRPDYWDNVELDNIAEIRLLNYDEAELRRCPSGAMFVNELGDGRKLTNYANKSIDLVHSNSVIEHVGLWPDACALAGEVRRVGMSGWIQTPAWEFPIEPHFRLPFVHWFSPPTRRWLLSASPDYRGLDTSDRRFHVDRINLFSYAEMRALFPDTDIYVEHFIFPKSYTARWGPPELKFE